MTDVLISRVDALLKHANIAFNDVKDKTLDEFRASDLLVRATCFSIVQVGEHMNRLAKYLSKDYPEIPWDKSIGMRNIIVHVYNNVKAEVVYNTAKNDVPELIKAFENIKSDLKAK